MQTQSFKTIKAYIIINTCRYNNITISPSNRDVERNELSYVIHSVSILNVLDDPWTPSKSSASNCKDVLAVGSSEIFGRSKSKANWSGVVIEDADIFPVVCFSSRIVVMILTDF